MANDTIVRAVTIAASRPLTGDWADFNKAMAACWRSSTNAANWCITELFRRDIPNEAKTPDAVKMGKQSDGRFYAYGEAKNLPWFSEWSGQKQSLNIVLQYAHREYLRRRFDVMVRHTQSLLTVRYPYPFPLDADVWKLSYKAGDFPVVSFALPGLGKVDLRLKRHGDFRRQLAMLKQIHAGTAAKGEAAVYKNSKGDLLVKIVGKFPRVERSKDNRVHACAMHTDPAALLVAEIDGRQPWILNCDHFRRWQAQHRDFLQRTHEDLKREKRMDRRQREQLNKVREERCRKHNDKLKTAIHSVSKQVVRFMERNQVATLAYDDANKEFIPDGFPWHMLKEQLRYKLTGMGVEFITTNDIERNKTKEIE